MKKYTFIATLLFLSFSNLCSQTVNLSGFVDETSPQELNTPKVIPVSIRLDTIKFVGVLADNLTIPKKTELLQNYPNPFNPSTTIRYTISQMTVISNPQRGERSFEQNVKLTIYDLLGREVKTLLNKVQSAGNYEVNFDASDLTSSVYYYQLKAGSFIETRKMSLLK